jgi:Protein tyrosine phosphatase-like protein, PTPLA
MMDSATDYYLMGYNLACALGWAFVWYFAVVESSLIPAVTGGDDDQTAAEALSNVYRSSSGDGSPSTILADCLFWSQNAAILEIVHAYLGLVRSPVSVTAMQVNNTHTHTPKFLHSFVSVCSERATSQLLVELLGRALTLVELLFFFSFFFLSAFFLYCCCSVT